MFGDTNDSQLNPYPWYEEKRESSPVNYNAETGMWSVFSYQDVQRVLSEHATFSSNYMGGGALSESLIGMDPPRHRQLRNIVTQAFTPRTVARLVPRITAIVNGLLDQAIPRGKMDVVDDLAYPLPITVIAELLGVPSEDRNLFRRWSNAIVSTSAVVGLDPETEMGEYFLRMIKRRREEPKDDLISALLAAQIDDEHLSVTEVLGFCFLLLVAGNETTTNLIGNAMLCLDSYPQTWKQLRAEPALAPAAVEEVLRYLSPVQSMFRLTTSETTIGDRVIPAHKMVLAWIASANRDEQQFPDADTFDIRRTPNRHIAFGHGIHFCLGAPLARLETKIVLEALLERFSEIQRVQNVPLQRTDSFFLYGLKHIPITFTPN
ncbi:MAG: cytochrome P450 [Ktedonobacteraceae bacterium]